MKTFLMILFIALCVGSAAAFIYLRITHVGLHGFWSKLVASALFVVGAFAAIIVRGGVHDSLYYVVLGLFFGMIGDALLELKLVYRPHDKQYTNAGILAFSLCHVCYIIGFSMYAGISKSVVVPAFVSLAIGAVLATIIIVNSPNLGVDFGAHKMPAYAYSFIVCISAVYGVALAILVPRLWIVAIGLVLFLVSDLVLSLIYWGCRNTNTMNIINLSTYYLAQILIMIFLFIA